MDRRLVEDAAMLLGFEGDLSDVEYLPESVGAPLNVLIGDVDNSSKIVPLTESRINSGRTKGALYLEGVFLQANVLNGNKRIYPKPVLAAAVDRYITEQVNTHQALGELNHPQRPMPNPEKACILIEKLWWVGNDVHGRARIIEGDGGTGDKLAALIRAGWVPGVSSRGLGRLQRNSRGLNEVQPGYRITVGVDVIWGPSAPDAHVRAIQESVHTNDFGGLNNSIENDNHEPTNKPVLSIARLVESQELKTKQRADELMRMINTASANSKTQRK